MANGYTSVRVTYGGGVPVVVDRLPVGSVLSCIRSNRNIATALGYDPSNVDFILNGTRANDSTVLTDGDLITVQTRAHEKASA